MKVFRAFRIVDNDVVADDSLPAKCGFTVGDVIGPLTNMRQVPGTFVPATVEILIVSGAKRQHISLAIEPFVFPDELESAREKPICFEDLRAVQKALAENTLPLKAGRWLWLFRDGFYVAERPVRESEVRDLTLAIKARHYRSDGQLKRLQAEVANFEALDQVERDGKRRAALRDDVKLLVWSRDGGRCVACHSQENLHFDHIIPFSRGGSDEAENIQLLCRACNLAKSDRIV